MALRRVPAPTRWRLAALAALAYAAVGAAAAQTFTDDAGRNVVLPARVERVFAAGAPAEVLLYTLVPEKLAGTRPDFYRAEFALGTDTLLVIEVSDTTLRYDRDVKVPLYARHGVPEAWIVDVQNDALLVWGDLRDGRYERHTVLARPASATVAALPGLTLNLAPVFGS